MKIIEDRVSIAELKEMAAAMFGDMVKAVVDVEKGTVAVDGELHADLEALLIEAGANQAGLWGINFYPDMVGDDFVEFDSMINIRPSQGNRSRGVDDPEVRKMILAVVDQVVVR